MRKNLRASKWLPRVSRIAALAVAFAAMAARADTVERRDGSRVDGAVVSVDAQTVVVKTARGPVEIPRSAVAVIRLTDAAPPLKVEIRNIRADDYLDVQLNDEYVIREARDGGEWVDITPKLKNGNNPLRLRIRNVRGIWAYDLVVRINGNVTPIACGTPARGDDPCTCCGKTGREVGAIDDLPMIWIYVDRTLGVAEVLR